MRKVFFGLILLFWTVLYADFIVPQFDPVYEFLEMTNTLRKSSLNHFQYPLYYHQIMKELESIAYDRTAGVYRNIAFYHQRRLNMSYEEGIEIAVYPANKLWENIVGLFRKNPTHQRLVTIAEPQSDTLSGDRNSNYHAERERQMGRNLNLTPQNSHLMYISGILGVQSDYRKIGNNTVDRMHRYYGIESAGSFSPNFGYYLLFRKGHYIGNADFIKENPYITWLDNALYNDRDRFYRVDMISEVDFKNRFLNLSTGYGSFDIGRTISSSIILNSNVTPYGYLKFNKTFGSLEYNGITSQLIPQRDETPAEFKPKGMAVQTIALKTQNSTFGLGNSILYSNRSFDLAYSTPFAIYKVIDNKYHGVDNGLFFGYGEIKPANGLNIYANFLFDDVKNSRFFTDKRFSYTAFQGGVLTLMNNFPMEVGCEMTIVGPSTYAHKSKYLTYMHDDMMLGHKNGSNFLSFVGRVRYHFERVSFSFLYENIQQGDVGYWPTAGAGEQKFLANNISRREFFKTSVDFRLIPELYVFAKYDYHKLPNSEIHYAFTGAEFKY